MNFDRNYTTQTSSNKNSQKLIGKIQKLPIVKRVYLYVLLLAAIGAIMGEGKYRLESKSCMTNDRCWTIEPGERRVRELGIGALAGMITATLISIPALFEE